MKRELLNSVIETDEEKDPILDETDTTGLGNAITTRLNEPIICPTEEFLILTWKNPILQLKKRSFTVAEEKQLSKQKIYTCAKKLKCFI